MFVVFQVTKSFLKENKCMQGWNPKKPTKLDGNDTTTLSHHPYILCHCVRQQRPLQGKNCFNLHSLVLFRLSLLTATLSMQQYDNDRCTNCVPLECSMFDIADNVIEIPFVKCAHSMKCYKVFLKVQQQIIIMPQLAPSLLLVMQARPTSARERRVCIYKLCSTSRYGAVQSCYSILSHDTLHHQ